MILVGLGANLDGAFGSPEECIKKAFSLLEESGVKVISVSSIWRTAPVPISEQPWYRNAVCVVETPLNPYELLSLLASIEDSAGRERRNRNEARVLDLDLLAYGDDVIRDQGLQIPHPRMHERAFVLYPLQEVAPEWIHPVFNKSVTEMIKTMPEGQKIERVHNKITEKERV